jgi:hypothetical protein
LDVFLLGLFQLLLLCCALFGELLDFVLAGFLHLVCEVLCDFVVSGSTGVLDCCFVVGVVMGDIAATLD